MKRVLLLIFSVTFISYASYAQKDNEFSSERLGELLNQYNRELIISHLKAILVQEHWNPFRISSSC